MKKSDFQDAGTLLSTLNFDGTPETTFPASPSEWAAKAAALAKQEHNDHCEIHGPYIYRGSRWQECPQCAQERARKQWEAHLLSRMREAGVGKRFINCTFGNWTVDESNTSQTGARDQLRDYVDNWKSNYEAGRGLIFSGSMGTGKTHLGCALVRFALSQKVSARILNFSDLMDAFKNSYRRDAEETTQDVKERFSEIGLLVIDEVGLGFGTEAETRLLTQIIDARYRECLPTVLISNLDSQALSDAIGARALSRFADAPFVRFDWPDHRRTLAKQQKSNGEQL